MWAALTEGDAVPEVDAVGLADASALREGDEDVVFEGCDDTVLSDEGDPLDESRAVRVASALRDARELAEGVLHVELDDDAVVVTHAESDLIALSVMAPDAVTFGVSVALLHTDGEADAVRDDADVRDAHALPVGDGVVLPAPVIVSALVPEPLRVVRAVAELADEALAPPDALATADGVTTDEREGRRERDADALPESLAATLDVNDPLLVLTLLAVGELQALFVAVAHTDALLDRVDSGDTDALRVAGTLALATLVDESDVVGDRDGVCDTDALTLADDDALGVPTLDALPLRVARAVTHALIVTDEHADVMDERVALPLADCAAHTDDSAEEVAVEDVESVDDGDTESVVRSVGDGDSDMGAVAVGVSVLAAETEANAELVAMRESVPPPEALAVALMLEVLEGTGESFAAALPLVLPDTDALTLDEAVEERERTCEGEAVADTVVTPVRVGGGERDNVELTDEHDDALTDALMVVEGDAVRVTEAELVDVTLPRPLRLAVALPLGVLTALSERRAESDDETVPETLMTAEAVASELPLPVHVADMVSALVDNTDADDVRVALALAPPSRVLAAVTVGTAEALAAPLSLLRADAVGELRAVSDKIALGVERAVMECCADGEWVVDALAVSLPADDALAQLLAEAERNDDDDEDAHDETAAVADGDRVSTAVADTEPLRCALTDARGDADAHPVAAVDVDGASELVRDGVAVTVTKGESDDADDALDADEALAVPLRCPDGNML